MAKTSQNEKCGNTKESLSLEDILLAFNNPVNEEQAWAVCFQCAQYFHNLDTQSLDCRIQYHELYKFGKRALKFYKDGSVFVEYSEISRGSGKGPPGPGKLKRKNSVTGKDIKIVTENDAIQALGLVIYQALDYGLGDNEERHLGRDLEHLLELMINPDEEDETFNADDEGIEKDAKEGSTFAEIKVLCIRHLTSQQDACYHYKAVCRALAAEAAELLTFLDKVSIGNERLVETQLDQDLQRLDNLQRADWARLWVQMMRELRQGVRLKKVEHTHLPTLEYELTPFEILLEDIRTRRYSLNKIMVNGDIPNTVKSDAHAMMLDFIRSRPPLQPAKNRVLKSPPKRELSVREQVLLHIRSQPPKLKSITDSHIVETSRTKLNQDDDTEKAQPIRKVIKPDFNLLLDSFEDDEDDDSSGTLSPKSRRCSLASPSPEKEVPKWRSAVVRDAVSQDRPSPSSLKRRNTITVCESPQVSPEEKDPKHLEHESKLKRNGPVSKSNACPNELRKRLNEKLHGRSSVSSLHSRRVHGSISEHPTESEQNGLSKNNHVIKNEQSESQPIRRAVSSVSRGSNQRNITDMKESPRSRRTSAELASESVRIRRVRSNEDQTVELAQTRPNSTESKVTSQTEQSNNVSESQTVQRSSYRMVSKSGTDSSQPSESRVRIHRRYSNLDKSSDSRLRIQRKVSDDYSSSNNEVFTRVQHRLSDKDEQVFRTQRKVSDSDDSLKEEASPSLQRDLFNAKRLSKREISSQDVTSGKRLELNGIENKNQTTRQKLESEKTTLNSADRTTDRKELRKLSSGDENIVQQIFDRNQKLRQRLSSSRAQSLQSYSDSKEKEISPVNRLRSDTEETNRISRRSSSRVIRITSGSTDRTFSGNKECESETAKKESSSSKPHSPRILVPKRSSSPVSNITSSPISPTSPTDVSTAFAGLTEVSSSPIKMHVSPKQSHDNACSIDSNDSDISLGRSVPSRRILVTRRSSMPTSKSCNDLEDEAESASKTSESLQRTQSVLDINPEKPRPKPRPRLSKQNSVKDLKSITSTEQTSSPKESDKSEEPKTTPPKPVPRPRTKLVQRSRSQLTSNRLSLDLSQLRAINRDEDFTHINGTDQDLTEHEEPPSPLRNFRSKTPGPMLQECETPSPRLSEQTVNELMNVSENTTRVQKTGTLCSSAPTCQDSRSPDSKWNHPIECLSLTLEEVMHIRTVLTKAELESLINQPEMYNLVSKGKVCFTCKDVKFSILGQWGNRCKICKRNVCNNCLRKMNIPTEHFHNIPVHTLSPIPLGQDALDILKVYESTGSVPHSPLTQKKLLQEIENKSPPRKKGLQRSQTFNSSPNLATPLPNKNLLKGPQMNVCCECKKMIMDIIRTSRTSIALLHKGKPLPSSESSIERKSSSLSASSLSLSVKNFFTQK